MIGLSSITGMYETEAPNQLVAVMRDGRNKLIFYSHRGGVLWDCPEDDVCCSGHVVERGMMGDDATDVFG